MAHKNKAIGEVSVTIHFPTNSPRTRLVNWAVYFHWLWGIGFELRDIPAISMHPTDANVYFIYGCSTWWANSASCCSTWVESAVLVQLTRYLWLSKKNFICCSISALLTAVSIVFDWVARECLIRLIRFTFRIGNLPSQDKLQINHVLPVYYAMTKVVNFFS